MLKRRSSKYKGKLPFKCFNYVKFGHYASKCIENKKKDYNPKEKFKKVQKDRNKAKNKGFYVQEENSLESELNQSSDEDKDDENPK